MTTSDSDGPSEDLLKELFRLPSPTRTAMLAPDAGGVPKRLGVYAWWQQPGALPGVTGPAHPLDADWQLVYIGIAPDKPTSKSHLRQRIVSNHLRGGLGSSTFRRTLVALLWEREGWVPLWTTDRIAFSDDDLAALAQWQTQHLGVTWVEHPAPWTVESEIVRSAVPPLNLAGNTSHPLYPVLRASRSRLSEAGKTR